MFQSMTITRELVLHLAKVILKHAVKLRLIYCVVMWRHVIDRRVCCEKFSLRL